MDVSMIPIFIMVSTMIELSSKFKNIIFWALTASIALIVFGIFVIDIFANDAQGKDKLSIIFSFLSAFFALLSSLGILITIGVYFSQKNDDKRKQKEIDEKLIYFIREKVSDFNFKIKRVLTFLENDDKYYGIGVSGNKIIYKDPLEDEYNITNTINLKLKNNDFLDRNNIHASLYLFIFILDIDSLSENFINKTYSYVMYSHAHSLYIPDEHFSCKDKNELIDFLKETEREITSRLNELYY
ncbi:TPA: hypothetical protein JAD17_001379 [Proteus mirabilis]|nr:hypothetical protein [Proteus mirabilis]